MVKFINNNIIIYLFVFKLKQSLFGKMYLYFS